MLQEANLSIRLREQEVLDDGVEDWPDLELHHFRKLMPRMISDNGFDLVPFHLSRVDVQHLVHEVPKSHRV